MKLKSSITSNSIKIIDLYNKIDSGVWDTSPDFQRKLVWKKQHKYNFINTILSNYPFPEIYIASEKMDIETLKSQEIVVDGKQRVTAIVDYIKGAGDFIHAKNVKPFSELEIDEKREFLNYNVTVKDLKDLEMDLIKDVFERINSTDYSLNSNERTNARYGDGEFSMFCKQIVDKEFNPTDNDTDIIIERELKSFLNEFFITNEVFTENDRNRMFDTQFIMLVVSTILEGEYFGRSTVINRYLEKYNAEFPGANDLLKKIVDAIKVINSLHFSANSYWFNKANLFILLVELSKKDPNNLYFDVLEGKLLELEKKVDIYFTDDDLSMISEQERKYFEYARQGSNELTAREHRGSVINSLLQNSEKEQPKDDLADHNLSLLEKGNLIFSSIRPTETGLKKAIIDATTLVRDFLKTEQFHDYENQELGPDNKRTIPAVYIDGLGNKNQTQVSLYRSNGRGDSRIWFHNLNQFANPNDLLLLLNIQGQLTVLNATRYNYSNVISK